MKLNLKIKDKLKVLKRPLLPAVLMLSVFCNTGLARQDETDDRFEELSGMSLEELMDIDVVTGSYHIMPQSKSPAVMTVITETQIKCSGAHSVSELLQYVPGFTKIGTYWKNDIITARGVKMSLYNDKTLMLINGVPANDASGMEHFLDAVPVAAIESIEIIRGPGSALYGSGAFAGVINIKTKHASAKNTVSVEGGSFGMRGAKLFAGEEIGDFEVTFGANFFENDGYKKELTDEHGTTQTINYETEKHSLFGSLKYKDIVLDVGMYKRAETKIGPSTIFHFGDARHADDGKTYNDKVFANLCAAHYFNEKLSGHLRFNFDYTDKQTQVGSFLNDVYVEEFGLLDSTVSPDYIQNSGITIGAEARVNYDYSEHAFFVAGVSTIMRRPDALSYFNDDIDGNTLLSGSYIDLPASDVDYEAFLQADGNIAGNLDYILGIRASYIGNNEAMYATPRAGLIYSFNSKNTLKLLYGEAFRSAAPHEQNYSVPKLVYGASVFGRRLEPEQIRTVELAWDIAIKEKAKFRINTFYTKVDDVINRRPATREELEIIEIPAMVYDNFPGQTNYGVEAEIIAYLTKDLNVFANITLKDGEENETGRDVRYMSNITSAGGINLFIGKFRISPKYVFVGEREGSLVTGEENTVPAFLLFNAEMCYRLKDNFSISISGENLTNTEYFYPEQVRNLIPTIPGGSGIGVYCEMTVEF